MATELAVHPVFCDEMFEGVHLLQADAGTGKTWTLTALVVRALIERGLPIGSILAMTFTTAAVGELRWRIRGVLETMITHLEHCAMGTDGGAAAIADPFQREYVRRIEALELRDSQGRPIQPADALRALRLAMAQIDDLSVQTIHSFCQLLLTRQTLASNSPARLEIDPESDQRLNRLVAAWWQQHTASLPLGELAVLSLMGIDLSLLRRATRLRLAMPEARLHPRPRDWREALASLDAELLSLRAVLDEEADRLLAAVAEKSAGALKVNGRTMVLKTASHHMDELRALASGEQTTRWPGKAFEKLGQAAFERAKANMQELQRYRIPAALDHLAQRWSDVGDAVLASMCAQACDSVRVALDDQIWQQGSLGFDDLLRLAREALEDPRRGDFLAARLRLRYRFALIDECQDTDAAQWAILRRIYPSGSAAGLVLVGDPKQAIYAFRGADVHAWLAVSHRWDGGEPPRLHRLADNQRSDGALLDGINRLFGAPDSFRTPRIQFEPALLGDKPRARFDGGEPAWDAGDRRARAPLTLVRYEAPEGEAALTAPRAQQRIAAAVAAEIARLLSPGGASIDGQALKPDQIAVLVHRNAEATQIRNALAAHGLGAVELTRSSVFASPAAHELIRIVAAIADPSDPSLLRGALVTALLGATADDLDSWAQDRGEWFMEAHQAWAHRGAQVALRRLLDRFDAFARTAGRADGDRWLTNLLHLLELIAQAPQARAGAAACLRWLGAQAALEDATEESEQRLERDDDVVRIVTIHRSKGLEYPVVFVPYGYRPRSSRARAGRQPLIYHDEAGQDAAQAIIDLSDSDGPGRERHRQEELEQDLRVLYVAVTRACHRCYLFAAQVRNSADSALGWLLREASGREAPDPDAPDEVEANGKKAKGSLIDLSGWHRMFGSSALLLDCDDLIEQAPGDRAGARQAAQALAPPEAFAAIGRSWSTLSYSALLSGWGSTQGGAPGDEPGEMQGEISGSADHDQRVDPVDDLADSQGAPDAPDESIRDSFPAGARAGSLIHALLESRCRGEPIDQPAIAAVLERWNFDEALAPGLVRWLSDLASARLEPLDFSLERLDRRDCWPEFEFELSARRASLQSIGEAIARRQPLLAPDTAFSWDGYLRGYIDLVFRHDGRYHLIDWKSNRLGGERPDYRREAMRQSVLDHSYALQYALYQVALHRHLRNRLPGYRIERDLGDVFYLYVRGTGRRGEGIWHVPADPELTQELDHLIGFAEKDR